MGGSPALPSCGPPLHRSGDQLLGAVGTWLPKRTLSMRRWPGILVVRGCCYSCWDWEQVAAFGLLFCRYCCCYYCCCCCYCYYYYCLVIQRQAAERLRLCQPAWTAAAAAGAAWPAAAPAQSPRWPTSWGLHAAALAACGQACSAAHAAGACAQAARVPRACKPCLSSSGCAAAGRPQPQRQPEHDAPPH
eukprot:1160147-Pelagomonas_calceolata.AAC.4